MLELHTRRDGLTHRDVEIDRFALSAVLGAVHRVVGVTPQRLIAHAMLRIDADAQRSRSEQLERLDVERLFQLLQHTLDDIADLLLAIERREQQQKLVAADARQHVSVAQAFADPIGDLDEQSIADGVAVVIVDVLGIVEVDEGEREAMAFALSQQLLDAALDEDSVRQAGEVVEIGAARQLVLDPFAVGDVVRGGHQKGAVADRHGLVGCQPGAFALRVGVAFLGGEMLAGSHQAELPLPPLPGLLGGQEVGRRAADQIGGGHREICRGDGIDQDERAFVILHRHADRKLLDDFLEEIVIGGRRRRALSRLVDQPAQPFDFVANALAAVHAAKRQSEHRTLARQHKLERAEIGPAGVAPQDDERRLGAHGKGKQQGRRSGAGQIRRKAFIRAACAVAADRQHAASADLAQQSCGGPPLAGVCVRLGRNACQRKPLPRRG